jgi:hypothetical protein
MSDFSKKTKTKLVSCMNLLAFYTTPGYNHTLSYNGGDESVALL